MNAASVPAAAASRLVSLDAFRGFVMLAMASDGLHLHRVAQNFPESRVWQSIGYQFDHVPWLGCAVWDLIQPAFMFMVGVAMAYSYTKRQASGESYGQMFAHAAKRAVILILLGIFLRSRDTQQTYFTFEDVLTQIGLGYVFLFLLWGRSVKVQLGTAALILLGYWALFFFYPLPPPSFNYAEVGVPADWPHLEGIAAHWDKNTNAAAAFDQWFLNLFPRESPFVYNSGGYLTLSFIPSLATMIFGLVTGGLLRSDRRGIAKVWLLIAAGIAGLALGQLLEVTGICPIVKRIWTPSWALFSAGWVCLGLAGFYAVIDLWNFRRWTFPLVVVGMNSIVMYCMAELLPGWIGKTLEVHFGKPMSALFGVPMFEILGQPYQPFVRSSMILLVMWLVCYWLYRQKIFIRI